ncbi:MAG: hypothetical protein KGY74_04580 [Candidatus Cloacimonetes bacterium]|nr:hypothetical protein [Candidatus Cloacimonadota bacterium]
MIFIIILLIILFVIAIMKRGSISYESNLKKAMNKCKTCKHNIIKEFPDENALLCDYEEYIKIIDVPDCPSYEKKDDTYTVDKDLGLDLGIK